MIELGEPFVAAKKVCLLWRSQDLMGTASPSWRIIVWSQHNTLKLSEFSGCIKQTDIWEMGNMSFYCFIFMLPFFHNGNQGSFPGVFRELPIHTLNFCISERELVMCSCNVNWYCSNSHFHKHSWEKLKQNIPGPFRNIAFLGWVPRYQNAGEENKGSSFLFAASPLH